MMYSEFLEHTGLTENAVSYEEYTKEIEPIYMDCKVETKQEFCKLYYSTLLDITIPVIERKMQLITIEEKEKYVFGCNLNLERELKIIRSEAKKIALEYLKLITNL